jgi:hypothetical protein
MLLISKELPIRLIRHKNIWIRNCYPSTRSNYLISRATLCLADQHLRSNPSHLQSPSLLQTLSPLGNVAEAKSSARPDASESRMHWQNTLPHLKNHIPSSQSTFHISGTSQGICHLCHCYKHFHRVRVTRQSKTSH